MEDERTGSGNGVDQVGLAVLVPEGAGILQAGLCDYDGGIAPRAGDMVAVLTKMPSLGVGK